MVPLILGHRGSTGRAPENTILAFGLDNKVDGFEFDVQLSRDGEVVICHDESVDRTSDGTGWIKDLSLRELKSLNFGVKFNMQAEIPTLKELLDLVQMNNLILNIEIKNTIFVYEGIFDKVISLLERYNMIGKSILSSFNHRSLAGIKEKYPYVSTGLLYCCNMVEPCSYALKLGASYLHPEWTVISSELVDECHAQGIKVNTWTVNDSFSSARALGAGVDGIITDFPQEMFQTKIIRDTCAHVQPFRE